MIIYNKKGIYENIIKSQEKPKKTPYKGFCVFSNNIVDIFKYV